MTWLASMRMRRPGMAPPCARSGVSLAFVRHLGRGGPDRDVQGSVPRKGIVIVFTRLIERAAHPRRRPRRGEEIRAEWRSLIGPSLPATAARLVTRGVALDRLTRRHTVA